MRTAVLVSGGIDSCALLQDLAAQGVPVLPIYVRAGLLWEGAELHWLRRFLAAPAEGVVEDLTILELPTRDLYQDHWSITGRDTPDAKAPLDSNYLPGRNLLLLAKTAVFCSLRGVDQVALAPLGDNPFPDATEAFFDEFARVAAVALDREFRVLCPYRRLSKEELIRRAAHLPLHLTFSCIRPVGIEHCGACTKCAERRRGFELAGVADPTQYRDPRPERSVGR
jgi:7-cyano-7-deazaguanine synthase